MHRSPPESRYEALQGHIGAVHPPLPLPPATANEHQVGGDHYQGRAMQPWDVVEAWDLDFWEGNALKYLLRRKPGVKRVDDLRKARHYLDKCIERELSATGTSAP